MQTRRRFLEASLLAPAILRAQDAGSEIDATVQNLDERLKRTLESIVHSDSVAEADAARSVLREKLHYSLGYRHFPRPASLEARTTGTVVRSGYRVEKVVYQSFPGTLVAAHLYLPDKIEKPAPALVFFNGHWPVESKMLPDHQAFYINMARLGFIAEFRFRGPGRTWSFHARSPPGGSFAGGRLAAGHQRIRDAARDRLSALPHRGGCTAARDDRRFRRRLQHLDDCGARRSHPRGRTGCRNQRVLRAVALQDSVGLGPERPVP